MASRLRQELGDDPNGSGSVLVRRDHSDCERSRPTVASQCEAAYDREVRAVPAGQFESVTRFRRVGINPDPPTLCSTPARRIPASDSQLLSIRGAL
jgi:hypothetical protein